MTEIESLRADIKRLRAELTAKRETLRTLLGYPKPGPRLTSAQRKEIVERLAKGARQGPLAREFNVDSAAISYLGRKNGLGRSRKRKEQC
jgi:outer membrane protein TolC